MGVAALVQARLTSSRLPGKVLKPFGAHPVLWHVVARCRAALSEDGEHGVIVLIPTGTANDPLRDWLAEHRIPFIRGPEDDVLARYVIGAAALEDPDAIVVRITADCPLVDAWQLARTAKIIIDRGAGYCHNRLGGPSDCARGLDVEAFTARELFRLAAQPDLTAYEREHVTTRWRRPERIQEMGRQGGPEPTAGMRWTLDTEEDYAWFCRLAQHVNTEPPHPTTEEVLAYIKETGDVLYEPEA